MKDEKYTTEMLLVYIMINPRNAGRKRRTGARSDRERILLKRQKECEPESKRQTISIISKFVVTDRSGILHDRDCSYVRRIRYCRQKDYIAPDETVRFCKYCQRRAILRNGVTDFKNYDVYAEYFAQNQVSTSLLELFFVKRGATATLLTDGINICCGEDKWKLRWVHNKNKSILEHNNYVRSADGTRYFVKGYHEQHIKKDTVTCAIRYIMAYNYEAYHGMKCAK